MHLIEEKIRKEGCVTSSEVLKVDAFLNHQIDMELVDAAAEEFVRRFAGSTITKVLTIETSGIAIACAVARLLKVPMVFAKKTRSMNVDGDAYVAEFLSFNHKNIKTVVVSKKYLTKGEQVLIIDDISRKYFTSDTSWLWDISFELLNRDNVRKITVAGKYIADVAIRLEYAGIDMEKVVLYKDTADAVKYLGENNEGELYALTCFSDEGKLLKEVVTL